MALTQCDTAEEQARLYEQIGRLKVALDWLKKNLDWPIDQRRLMVEPLHPHITIARQCALLGLSRSVYYYSPHLVSAPDQRLMRLIDEEDTRHPFFGSRRLRDWLHDCGHRIGRDRVRRLMHQMGIEAIAPTPRVSLPDREHRVYPYLLRSLDIVRPDQVWCSDITYLRLHRTFAYLTVIMDWFKAGMCSPMKCRCR